MKDTSFRVSYIGSRSVTLFSSPDLNQVSWHAHIRFGIEYLRDPNTGAWYYGFTTEVNRRSAKGLSYQVSYN